eukprot:UN07901
MAFESIQSREYSIQSDIWMFGVFIWEVLTDGAKPYEDKSPEQVIMAITMNQKLKIT